MGSPIVCVFSDDEIRDRTMDALAATGFSPKPAGTVEDGLAAITDDVVAVVCGDRFPDGDGVELIERVIDRRPNLPTVLAPEAGSEALANRALAAGAVDYVPQSVGPTELGQRVKTAIGPRRASEPHFRALVEQATDVFGIMSPDGQLDYVSPSVEQVLGYDQSALIDETAFAYVHPEDHEAVVAEFETVVDDPDYRGQAEFRFETVDGEWRVLNARARNRLDDPAVEGIVVNAHDITERKAREQELKTQRALLDGIFRTIPDVVFAFDPDGEPLRDVAFLNPIAGYEPEEVAEMDPLEFVPEEDQAAVADAVNRVLEEGGTETIESALVTKDGELVPHEFKGTRLTDESGTVLGIVGAARDISARVARERELERQNERLEEFAGVVSHDLRNPLNVVLGRLELAASGDDPAANIEAALRSAERMEARITDLLSLTRQGRSIGETGPVDLDEVATRAWEAVDTAGVQFDRETLGTVVADGTRLGELLENLFRNAVEHGGDRTPGRVTQGAETDDGTPDQGATDRAGPLTVTIGPLNDGFFVADNGPGIPEAERETVLEHGYTTDPTGTGLGLSIVRSITEAHGWEVRVTESSSGGARFEITGVERPDQNEGETSSARS